MSVQGKNLLLIPFHDWMYDYIQDWRDLVGVAYGGMLRDIGTKIAGSCAPILPN